jgi:RHS repeat-associated protein
VNLYGFAAGDPVTYSDPYGLSAEECPPDCRIAWSDGLLPCNPSRRAGEHWQGTLLNEKRDASGLLYRRNRYYDPATGRFTQEDPIGLAGGVNLYGFANGDPVSYSDPYGLCPESLRTANDRCPGNLSVGHYAFLEQGASNLETDPKAQFLAMLEAGLINAEALEGTRLAHTVPSADGQHRIVFNTRLADGTSFFDTPHPGDVAWVAGHEIGHVRQFQGRTPLGSAEAVWVLSGVRGSLGDLFRGAMEVGADRFACANARNYVFSTPLCR